MMRRALLGLLALLLGALPAGALSLGTVIGKGYAAFAASQGFSYQTVTNTISNMDKAAQALVANDNATSWFGVLSDMPVFYTAVSASAGLLMVAPSPTQVGLTIYGRNHSFYTADPNRTDPAPLPADQVAKLTTPNPDGSQLLYFYEGNVQCGVADPVSCATTSNQNSGRDTSKWTNFKSGFSYGGTAPNQRINSWTVTYDVPAHDGFPVYHGSESGGAQYTIPSNQFAPANLCGMTAWVSGLACDSTSTTALSMKLLTPQRSYPPTAYTPATLATSPEIKPYLTYPITFPAELPIIDAPLEYPSTSPYSTPQSSPTIPPPITLPEVPFWNPVEVPQLQRLFENPSVDPGYQTSPVYNPDGSPATNPDGSPQTVTTAVPITHPITFSPDGAASTGVQTRTVTNPDGSTSTITIQPTPTTTTSTTTTTTTQTTGIDPTTGKPYPATTTTTTTPTTNAKETCDDFAGAGWCASGTPPPEPPNTDWTVGLEPLKALFPGLLAWTSPAHAGDCPVPVFQWLDGTTVTAHQPCDALEALRNIVTAGMTASWTLAALFMILKA